MTGPERVAAARESARWVTLSAFVLALVGLLAIYSVTAVGAVARGWVLSDEFVRQLLRLATALLVGAAVARCDHRFVADRSVPLMALVWIGLIAVLVVGVDAGGARRWVRVLGINLQVSEIAKLAVVVACAQYVHRRAAVIGEFRRGFLPGVAWVAVTVGLIAVEPDFGTSMFVLFLGMAVFLLGGVKLRHVAATGAVALPAFVAVMLASFDHIGKRLATLGSDRAHFQVQRALEAMGSGGLGGRGLGAGQAHLAFVPEVHTDFIFSAIAEQAGLLGSLVVVGLFAFFAWHGFRIARLASDDRGALIAFGVTFMIAFQAAINVSVVTGLVPPKGISLPFVSYGGSGLLGLGVGVGLLVSVARSVSAEDPVEERTEAEEPRRGHAERPSGARRRPTRIGVGVPAPE